MPVSPTSTPPAEPLGRLRTVQVAMERDAACARRSDGSVWCWGDVFSGYRADAMRVKGLPAASHVAVSDERACIVAERDGSVWCWGRALDFSDRAYDPLSPRQVVGLPPMAKVALWQGEHTRRYADDRAVACGLGREGDVWCWEAEGEPVSLGGRGGTDIAMGAVEVCSLQDESHHCAPYRLDGKTMLEAKPFPFQLISVAFMGLSRCGHLRHGVLHCWGEVCGKASPPQGCDIGAPGVEIVDVAGGLERLLVSHRDTMHGYRYVGHFSQGIHHEKVDARFVSAAAAGSHYACGVTVDGETRCWGYPRVGEPDFFSLRPFARLEAPIHRRYRVPVRPPVAVGDTSICGLGPDGDLSCWASRRLSGIWGEKRQRVYAKRLGGTKGSIRAHVSLGNICVVLPGAPARCLIERRGALIDWEDTRFTAMHEKSSCATIGPERKLYCRVNNQDDELIASKNGPLDEVAHVAVRVRAMCAVRRGEVFCREHAKEPVVRVEGLPPGVTEVALGEAHRCVLAEGRVWCWGSGDHGQLGRGVMRSSKRPKRVEGLGGIRHIAAAYRHTCALDASGAMYCWGGNLFGQLGDGTRMSRSKPKRVEGVTGVVSMELDDATTCAAGADETICWGQGAWHALDRSATGGVPDPKPPHPMTIGGAQAAPPGIELVEVSLR